MLHYEKLHSLFFETFPIKATDFIALSGYIGPEPIKRLGDLPFRSKIIYGLHKENQKIPLHNQLRGLHNDSRKIYYPDIACHSKCYLWLNGQTPVKGLIGSANFSSNGLFNDFRESLFEVEENQLVRLKDYIELILDSAKECITVTVVEPQISTKKYDKEVCQMVLYDPKTGETQPAHGLNWGFANAHVRPNDSCIPLRMEHIKMYPKLFSPLQPNPVSRKGTLNEVMEFVWDDGVVMQGRFEGSQPYRNRNLKFPKQIASFPHKDEMGIYIRNRLGVALGQRVLRRDLLNYGRDTISVSLIEEGIYYFDFSVKRKNIGLARVESPKKSTHL